MIVVMKGLRVAAAVVLASCALHLRRNPGRDLVLNSTSSASRLTSLPLWTHRLHGRALSHLRCFFLQLIHAEATWALFLRLDRGDNEGPG